jgi:hypothetical protein
MLKRGMMFPVIDWTKGRGNCRSSTRTRGQREPAVPIFGRRSAFVVQRWFVNSSARHQGIWKLAR